MVSIHILQMPILIMLLSFVSVASATHGCPNELVEMRIKSTDFPNLRTELNTSDSSNQSLSFKLIYHCRAHNYTEPTWVTKVVLTITLVANNVSYFSLLQYECNTSTSNFSAPTELVALTAYNSTNTLHSVYLRNNSDVDFCYDCVNDTSKKFCSVCHTDCNTTATNDLKYCYGPSIEECCYYVQNDTCVSQCDSNYYPSEESVCTECNLECGNRTRNVTACECVCNLGYSGDQCESYLCGPNTCENGGNCSVIGTLAAPNTSCTCLSGYNGTYCETIVDPCISNSCNNGTCTMINTTNYSCTCHSGYFGSDCLYPDECSNTTPCNNNGNCIRKYSMPYFRCNCTEGITGENCQYNQYCDNRTETCQNGGSCIVYGAEEYNCSCAPDYTGENCETSTSTVTGSSGAVIAVVLIILIIIIVIVIVVLVVVLVYFFYLKPKKGKIEISKKTSRVHPTNGDNGTVDEKAPILKKQKH